MPGAPDKVAVAAVISDYNFGTKTAFFNAYFIGKLNTTLRDKTVSVDQKKTVLSYPVEFARLSNPNQRMKTSINV